MVLADQTGVLAGRRGEDRSELRLYSYAPLVKRVSPAVGEHLHDHGRRGLCAPPPVSIHGMPQAGERCRIPWVPGRCGAAPTGDLHQRPRRERAPPTRFRVVLADRREEFRRQRSYQDERYDSPWWRASNGSGEKEVPLPEMR